MVEDIHTGEKVSTYLFLVFFYVREEEFSCVHKMTQFCQDAFTELLFFFLLK